MHAAANWTELGTLTTLQGSSDLSVGGDRLYNATGKVDSVDGVKILTHVTEEENGVYMDASAEWSDDNGAALGVVSSLTTKDQGRIYDGSASVNRVDSTHRMTAKVDEKESDIHAVATARWQVEDMAKLSVEGASHFILEGDRIYDAKARADYIKPDGIYAQVSEEEIGVNAQFNANFVQEGGEAVEAGGRMAWDHKEVFDGSLSAVHVEADQRVAASAHEAVSQLGMHASADWNNAAGLAGLKMASNLTLDGSRVFTAAGEGRSVEGKRTL